MRLSRLVYECVKASTAVHEASFTFEEFMAAFKDVDSSSVLWNSAEYSRSFDRVFRDINAFFLRLMEMDNILPDMTEDISDKIVLKDGEHHFDHSDYPINNIRLIFQYGHDHAKQNVAFDDFGKEYIIHSYDANRPVYMTYSIAIPRFTREDLLPLTQIDSEDGFDGVAETDENVELSETYHIPEKAFALCIDFVHAKQKDDYEPSVASAMMVEVESKLQGLRKENVGPMDDKIEVGFRI